MSLADIFAFVGSVLTFVSVVIGAWLNLRKTGEVHSIVNSQHEDLVKRNSNLVNALKEADVNIPPQEEGSSTPQ
jgi:hypothetical protein